jgi:hypothetical protein
MLQFIVSIPKWYANIIMIVGMSVWQFMPIPPPDKPLKPTVLGGGNILTPNHAKRLILYGPSRPCHN